MKMAPGSSGYYLFQLENTRNEALDVTVSFEESGSMAHLPLKFTLTPQGQTAGGVSGTLAEGEVLSLKTRIAGKERVVYRLDWEWPFESGSDAADTEAGSQGGVYMLMLSIYAQGGE